jgi:hypothetical protein
VEDALKFPLIVKRGDYMTQEPKKISLIEAAKQMLAQKKQMQGNAASQQKFQASKDQTRKSQQTKKPNNQKKRTGV